MTVMVVLVELIPKAVHADLRYLASARARERDMVVLTKQTG